MLVARLDPDLRIRIVGVRELHYTEALRPGEDRPPHVRAASGLAFVNGQLAVIQDDAAFVATVAADAVGARALPRGAGGRRRFEVALGNKQDKLDLEACLEMHGRLWVFGSGSTPARERIVIVGPTTHALDAHALYETLRAVLGGYVNIEGAAAVGGELWLCHRGNTGPTDRPAIVRFPLTAFASWLDRVAPVPDALGCLRVDLGRIADVPLGFTDAAGAGARAFYLATAEASPNAIDDGRALGSQLGVIDGEAVRACVLEHDGVPLKAEGLAFDRADASRVWIACDPDDVERAATLYEAELLGPW